MWWTKPWLKTLSWQIFLSQLVHCLPQLASSRMFVHILSLTVDQAEGSAAFPTLQEEVDIWGCCISVTTERLSGDHSSLPTSPPSLSAAQGHQPQRTIHTKKHKEKSSHILHYLINTDLYCSLP